MITTYRGPYKWHGGVKHYGPDITVELTDGEYYTYHWNNGYRIRVQIIQQRYVELIKQGEAMLAEGWKKSVQP